MTPGNHHDIILMNMARCYILQDLFSLGDKSVDPQYVCNLRLFHRKRRLLFDKGAFNYELSCINRSASQGIYFKPL
jgi:hypothetical protein